MSETLYNASGIQQSTMIEAVDINGTCWIEVEQFVGTDRCDIVLSQSDAARLGWALVDRYA